MKLALTIFAILYGSSVAFAQGQVRVANIVSNGAVAYIRNYTGNCTLNLHEGSNIGDPLQGDQSGTIAQTSTDVTTWSDGTIVVKLGANEPLTPNTDHLLAVTGCMGLTTVAFKTRLIPMGATVHKPIKLNASSYSHTGPVVDLSVAAKKRIYRDNYGLKHILIPGTGEFGWRQNMNRFYHYAESGVGWTNPANACGGYPAPATYGEVNTNSYIDCYPQTDNNVFDGPFGGPAIPFYMNLDDLGLVVWGGGDDAAAGNRQVRVCMFISATAGCAGPWYTITLPQTAAGVIQPVLNPASSWDNQPWPGAFPQLTGTTWGVDLNDDNLRYGLFGSSVTVTGGSTLTIAAGSVTLQNHFPRSVAGQKIYISGTGVCVRDLCTIASQTGPTTLTISEVIPDGNYTNVRKIPFGIRIEPLGAMGTVKRIGVRYNAVGSIGFDTRAEGFKIYPEPVVRPDGNVGYALLFNNLLYWIKEDGTDYTAASNLTINRAVTDLWPVNDQPGNGYETCPGGASFATAPNEVYCSFNGKGGHAIILKATYTGDWTTPAPEYQMYPMVNAFGSGSPVSSEITWSRFMVPSTNSDLSSIITAGTPEYDATLYGTLSGTTISNINFNGRFIQAARLYGAQDVSPCWNWIIDAQTKTVVFKNHTLTDAPSAIPNYPSFYNTCHSFASFGAMVPNMFLYSMNWLTNANPALLHTGPYRANIYAVLRGGIWDAANTAYPTLDVTGGYGTPNAGRGDGSYDDACPGGLPAYLQAKCPQGTGRNFIHFRMTGAPCNETINATEVANFPACEYDAAKAAPQVLKVGMQFQNAGDPTVAEFFQVATIENCVGGKCDVGAIRNSTLDYSCMFTTRNSGCMGNPVTQFSGLNGWTAVMRSGFGGYLEMSPDGSSYNYAYPPYALQGHVATGKNGDDGTYTATGFLTTLYRRSDLQGIFSNLPVSGNTSTNRARFNAFENDGTAVQGYLGFLHSVGLTSRKDYVISAEALNPGYGVAANNIGNQIGIRTVTGPVAGTTDVYLVPSVVFNGATTRNGMELNWVGVKYAVDISGPTADIKTAPVLPAKCTVLRATEDCGIAGAVVGDTYFRSNFMFVDPTGCNTAVWFVNIPCRAMGLPSGGGFRRKLISRADATGVNNQFLGFGLQSTPGSHAGFWSIQTFPHGKLAGVFSGMNINGHRGMLSIVQLPPYYDESLIHAIGRATYGGLVMKVPPTPAMTHAAVRFGTSPALKYTTRNEVTITDAVITQFAFAGDTLTPEPCVANVGCNINIPARPDEIVYTQLGRKIAGVWIWDSNIIPVANGAAPVTSTTGLQY